MDSAAPPYSSRDRYHFQQKATPIVQPLPEDEARVEEAFLQQTTQWIPRYPFESQLKKATLEVRTFRRPSISSSLTAQQRPVVIPRVAIAGLMSSPLPFLRAYSPVLQLHGIDEHEFVAFIDYLTVVQQAPAPLQALNVAGTAISFV